MKNKKHNPKGRFSKGYAALLVASLLMGANKYLFKLVLLSLPVVPFMAVRHTVAGVLVLPVASRNWKKLSPRQYGRIFLLSAIGLGGSNGLWAVGAKHSTLLAAGLLGLLSPIFTYIFAAVLLRESMSRRAKIGAVMAFFGAAALVYVNKSGSGSQATLFGPVLMIMGNAIGALMIVLSKKTLAHLDPAQFSALQLMFVGLPFMAVMFITGSYVTVFHMSKISLIALALLCTTNGGFAWMIENYAIKRVKASVMAEQDYIDVLVVSLLAVFIAGDILNGQILLGSLLILLGSIVSHQHVSKVWVLHRLKTTTKAVSRALRQPELTLERLVGCI